jgi:hypothetical protein
MTKSDQVALKPLELVFRRIWKSLEKQLQEELSEQFWWELKRPQRTQIPVRKVDSEGWLHEVSDGNQDSTGK